jgi:hypothetical protein
MKNPILTAHVGTNADLFPAALKLYAREGSKILDMTYGLGVFWRKVDLSKYDITKNDLDPERGDIHEDFRCMSFLDGALDTIVLDPPYASRSSNKKSLVGSLYNNSRHHLNTVQDVLKFYRDGMVESHRILKAGGILFVKCMDEISGGKQARNHISIWKDALEIGFIDEDLFDLLNPKTPIMRHNHQLHARKNNSFLWVFRK